MFFNLADPKNPNARLALLTKSITPEDFTKVDIRKLASDDIKQQRKIALADNMRDKRTDWATEEVKA